MKLESDSDVFYAALYKWGANAQLSMVIEESAELILAIQHYIRGRGSLSRLCEELADAQIMLEQLKVFVQEQSYTNPSSDKAAPDFEEWYERKMNRLRCRLGEVSSDE